MFRNMSAFEVMENIRTRKEGGWIKPLAAVGALGGLASLFKGLTDSGLTPNKLIGSPEEDDSGSGVGNMLTDITQSAKKVDQIDGG